MKKALVIFFVLTLCSNAYAEFYKDKGMRYLYENAYSATWNTVLNAKKDIEKHIKNTFSVYKCVFLSNRTIQQCNDSLLATLAEQYPGSNFDIMIMSGVIVHGNKQYTLDRGRLVRYTNQDKGYLYDASFTTNTAKIKVFDDAQYVSFVVKLDTNKHSKHTIYIESAFLDGQELSKEMIQTLNDTFEKEGNQPGDYNMFDYINTLMKKGVK